MGERPASEAPLTRRVPDWRSDAPDAGRAHLWESIAFVRERAGDYGGDPERVVLAGWSLGGRAAAGIGVNKAAAVQWRPSAVVCIASFGRPAPSTGSAPLGDLARPGPRTGTPKTTAGP